MCVNTSISEPYTLQTTARHHFYVLFYRVLTFFFSEKNIIYIFFNKISDLHNEIERI